MVKEETIEDLCKDFVNSLNLMKKDGKEPIALGLRLSVIQFDDHDFDYLSRQALMYGLEQGSLVVHSYAEGADPNYPDPLVDIYYTLPKEN